jgi:hypothetical protein
MWGRKNENEKERRQRERLRQIRDRATAESWPMDDPRANYDRAEHYRETRAEGASRAPQS